MEFNLADTDLAENLELKDTPQKIWATIFDFYYISPLEIAENLVLADKSSVADFPAKSSFHCITTMDFSPKGHRQFWKPTMIFNTVVSYSNENFFVQMRACLFPSTKNERQRREDGCKKGSHLNETL